MGRSVLRRHVPCVGLATGWTFFLLVQAFYAGALTMFFSSSTDIPFSSAREGLLLYPRWKMVLPTDERVLVDFLAKEARDPPFVEFYQRSEEPGQERIS